MEKKKKVIISIVLAAVIVLSSVIVALVLTAPKKIKVGVLAGNPMAYQTSDGEWTGYDIDFATKLFTDLEYDKIEFVEVDALNREEKLEEGEIDCYMSGTDIIDVHGAIYTDEYIQSKQVFIYSKQSGVNIASPEELKEYRLGMLDDSENIRTVSQYLRPEGVQEYKNNADIAAALNDGIVDLALVDYSFAASLVKNDEKFKEYTIGIIYDDSAHMIFLPEKKEKLKLKIDQKIAEYKEQKFFQTLKEAYFMQEYYY